MQVFQMALLDLTGPGDALFKSLPSQEMTKCIKQKDLASIHFQRLTCYPAFLQLSASIW